MCLAQGHNTVTPERLEHAATWSRVNHSTTEPLPSLKGLLKSPCGPYQQKKCIFSCRQSQQQQQHLERQQSVEHQRHHKTMKRNQRKKKFQQREQKVPDVFTHNVCSKTCVKRSLSKRPKFGFQDQLSLNAGKKYCSMLQGGNILQYF